MLLPDDATGRVLAVVRAAGHHSRLERYVSGRTPLLVERRVSADTWVGFPRL